MDKRLFQFDNAVLALVMVVLAVAVVVTPPDGIDNKIAVNYMAGISVMLLAITFARGKSLSPRFIYSILACVGMSAFFYSVSFIVPPLRIVSAVAYILAGSFLTIAFFKEVGISIHEGMPLVKNKLCYWLCPKKKQ